jgi:hypothetical protein
LSIKSWIGFNDEDFNKWKHICTEFVRWFDQNYRSNKISRDDHACRFPVLWYSYNLKDFLLLKTVFYLVFKILILKESIFKGIKFKR